VSITFCTIVLVIICLGALLQSAVGFGIALFTTPLLVYLGMSLPQAIALVATCSFFQSAMGAKSLSSTIPWKLTFTAIPVSSLFCIIGIFILKWLSSLSPDDILFWIGAILCLLVLLKITIKIRTYDKIHWGWGAIAFSLSGLISGICGMGGPPLVIWTLFHNWSVKKIRGFLFSVFMGGTPIYLIVLFLMFGNKILWSMAIGVMLFPAILVGTFLGLYIGNRMSKKVLLIVAYSTLFIIGIKSVMPAILTF